MKSKSIYLLITLFYFTLSCSTNNLEEETTGKTLGFKTTLAKELVLPIGITNINDSYQPFGSNSVFFLNEHSKTLYELDLIKNKIDSISTLDSLTFFDGFIVEPKSKLAYIFYHDKVQIYAFNGELKRIIDLATTCDTSTYLTVLNQDRKSTRLNSSHVRISYAVFCSSHHRYLHSFPTRRSSDLIDSISTLDSLTFFDGFIVEPKSKLAYIFYHDKVQIYAFNGELKRIIDLATTCDTSTYLTVLNQTYLPHIYDNSIFIQSFPAFEESYTNPLFFQEPIMKSFNLQSMDCQTTKAFYPSNYQQNCYGVNYIPEKVVLENKLGHKIGFTYAYNDSVFIYDADLESTQAKFFGSKMHTSIVKQLPFDKIDQYNQSVLDDLYAVNPHYAFTKSFPLAGFVGRSLLVKNGSKITEFLCLYDDKFEYLGESNGIWKSNILCDSEQGVKSIQLRTKEKRLIINDVTWE